MRTQPHRSPDDESRSMNKDAATKPVADEPARRLIEGAEQQFGAGEQVETPATKAYDPRATKAAELDDALDDSFPGERPAGADEQRSR